MSRLGWGLALTVQDTRRDSDSGVVGGTQRGHNECLKGASTSQAD